MANALRGGVLIQMLQHPSHASLAVDDSAMKGGVNDDPKRCSTKAQRGFVEIAQD